MITAARIAASHGQRSACIRGTVTKSVVSGMRPCFFGLFKERLPGHIEIDLDRVPYCKFIQMLENARAGTPARHLKIDWGEETQEPRVGERVRVTFAYCMVDGLEQFFNGAPAISLQSVEIVTNEFQIKEGEFVDEEPQLPFQIAATA